YLDEYSGEFSIRAMDMETRKNGVLATNSIISWPTYDKLDASVAFTAKSGSDTVINIVGLKPDKISPAGNPRLAVTGYKWPVFLAKGVRFPQPIPVARPGLRGLTQL